MAFQKLFWRNTPNATTPLSADNLNRMEDGIAAAYVVGQGGLTNADLSANAAVDPAKLAGYPNDATQSLLGDATWGAPPVAPSSITGYPGDVTKYLLGDGTWGSVVFTAISYRKTTAKAVNTTVSATDLLNGEVTVAAGALGATGMLRLTAWGDFLQNTGGNASGPRFQLLFGGSSCLDTTGTTSVTASSGRQPWRVVAEILNSATNAQTANLLAHIYSGAGIAAGQNSFTAGTGGGTPTVNGWVAWGVNSALAVDTTAAKALVLNVVNGSSSASYETKLLGALVEVI